MPERRRSPYHPSPLCMVNEPNRNADYPEADEPVIVDRTGNAQKAAEADALASAESLEREFPPHSAGAIILSSIQHEESAVKPAAGRAGRMWEANAYHEGVASNLHGINSHISDSLLRKTLTEDEQNEFKQTLNALLRDVNSVNRKVLSSEQEAAAGVVLSRFLQNPAQFLADELAASVGSERVHMQELVTERILTQEEAEKLMRIAGESREKFGQVQAGMRSLEFVLREHEKRAKERNRNEPIADRIRIHVGDVSDSDPEQGRLPGEAICSNSMRLGARVTAGTFDRIDVINRLLGYPTIAETRAKWHQDNKE